MGTDRSRDAFSGILTPYIGLRDPSACLWDAESDYTQASPTPGLAKPTGRPMLVLEPSGTRTGVAANAASSIEVRCIRGGLPGRSIRGGGFAWRETTDDADGYRGWEPPATITAWECPNWTGTDGPSTYPHVACLKTPAHRDKVVVVFRGAAGFLRSMTRATDGTWSSIVDIHSEGAGFPVLNPCLVEVGTRLFCLAWVLGLADLSTTYFIRSWVSDDGGATWSIARHSVTIETDCIGAASGSSYGVGMLRAAEKDGQVVVFGHLKTPGATTHNDTIRQWASSDLSMRLDVVETWDSDASGLNAGPFDLVATGGFFTLAYVRADGQLYWRRIGSAYQPLSTAPISVAIASATGLAAVTTGPPTDITAADVTLCVDDAGIIWEIHRMAGGGAASIQSLVINFSDDDGVTFQPYGLYADSLTARTLSGLPFRTASTGDHYLINLAACFQRGRLVLVHNWFATTATDGNSLGVAYLGGYHTITVPPTREGVQFADRTSYEIARLPIERAQDTSTWAVTTTGTAGNALAQGYEYFSSGDGLGAAGNIYVDATDSKTGDVAWLGTWACYPIIGADWTSALVSMQVRIDDGTRGIEVGVYMDADEFKVYDVVSAAALFQRSGLTTGPREYRMGVYGNEAGSVLQVRLFYRDWNMGEDREWKFAGAGTLSDDGGTVGNNRVRFGHVASGGAATQVFSRWYSGPNYSFGDISVLSNNAGTAHHWHTWVVADDNPTSLAPRNYSGQAVYVTDGTVIEAKAGPAFRGDVHTIPTEYEFGLKYAFPSVERSPALGWRSKGTAAAVNIAMYLSDDVLAVEETHFESPLWGIYLGGINWRNGELQRWDVGTAAWVKLFDIDAATGTTGMTYARVGSSLVPGGSDAQRFTRGELTGWTADINGTERRITGNSAGLWHSTTTSPRARIRLDGATTGDPTSAGTLSLWSPDVLVLFHPDDTAAGYRLVIDAQDTVDGYFSIGTLILGPVHVFAKPYDRGARYGFESGAEIKERADRSTVLSLTAPDQREIEVEFRDGIYEGSYWDTTTAPDYVRTTSTATVEAAVMPATMGADIEGVLRDLAGHPGVFIPRIEQGTPDTIHLTRRSEKVYGSPGGRIDYTHRHGDEEDDALGEIGRVRWREEV